MYSIGVDIGGSHIASCMFEHANKKLNRTTLGYTKVDTKASKEEIIRSWVSTITKSIKLADRPIEGIGIAMPGPFNYSEGISLISDVDKLDALFRINIREELASELGIEASKIRFINDASAFSIAEAMVGKASPFQRVVAITLGTGFGSSFVISGQPIIKADNVPEGGFLYNKLYLGDVADDVFSTRGLINHYKEKTGKMVPNVRELCERAENDESAAETFNWFGRELGKFLQPYLSSFGAEILVIGGNISKASAYFNPSLTKEIPGVETYISDLGEEAAMIGGALLLQDEFYNQLLPTLKLM